MAGLFFGMSGLCKHADENGNMDLILHLGAVEAIIAVCIALLIGLGAFVALM
jgi:hypothetical protein